MTGEDAAPATRWLGETPERWRQQWQLPMLRIYRRVGSTNDVARALAEAGAPPGTVVLADEQVRGRGRHGRSWSAPPGTALLLTMILPADAATRDAVLPLRLGLAAAAAIETVAPVEVRLKWPNDLFSDGRKLGGLLCEAVLDEGRPIRLVAGIGINVSQRPEDWPPELRDSATSLEARAGRAVDRATLTGAVIRAFLDTAAAPGGPLRPEELEQIARRDLLRGHPVTLEGEPAGVASGIGADGALITDGDGGRRRVVAGTVRLAVGQGPA